MSDLKTNDSTIYKMPKIKHIIAVGSGKGGVGKSTVTVNLAYNFAKKGYKVGIMDADIYGPSIPHMLCATGKPEISEDKRMLPHYNFSIYSNSMGYIINPKIAASWRGPMASKAVFQLFFQTAWPELDYLFIDMPPGTGDVQLSLASKIPVTGAILVTTPQEISVMDVRKAADFFRKVNVKLIGIIENMSFFEDTNKEKNYLFGKDGGKKLAEEINCNFLGQIKIDPILAQNSDQGVITELDYFNDIYNNVKAHI